MVSSLDESCSSDDCRYDDDYFEMEEDKNESEMKMKCDNVEENVEEKVQSRNKFEQARFSETTWKVIDFRDINIGGRIGGGGVGIIYRGTFQGKLVALKTLVSVYFFAACLGFN